MGVGLSSVHAERWREREHLLCCAIKLQAAVKLHGPLAQVYWLPYERERPWKIRQLPDWDAVTETGLFTVKFSELEWRLSRSWMDYVKIMKSLRLKMEEDSLAIVTSCVLVPSPPGSLHLSLSFYFTDSVACTHALLPLLRSAIIIFCEFPMWQCGTEPA